MADEPTLPADSFALCQGPICVNCCLCRDCGRHVGTRHLDVCACGPEQTHWYCPECNIKRIAATLTGSEL